MGQKTSQIISGNTGTKQGPLSLKNLKASSTQSITLQGLKPGTSNYFHIDFAKKSNKKSKATFRPYWGTYRHAYGKFKYLTVAIQSILLKSKLFLTDENEKKIKKAIKLLKEVSDDMLPSWPKVKDKIRKETNLD